MNKSSFNACHCEERSDVGRKGAPPVAESSDRSGWAGTCLCTNEVQGKGLVPTRKSQGSLVRLKFPVNRCQEIATAPMGPRNDIRDMMVPQNSKFVAKRHLNSSFFILHSSSSLTPPSISPAEPCRQTCRSCRRGSGRWGSGRWKAPEPPRPWARPSGRPADTGS